MAIAQFACDKLCYCSKTKLNNFFFIFSLDNVATPKLSLNSLLEETTQSLATKPRPTLTPRRIVSSHTHTQPNIEEDGRDISATPACSLKKLDAGCTPYHPHVKHTPISEGKFSIKFQIFFIERSICITCIDGYRKHTKEKMKLKFNYMFLCNK